ncbi:RBCMT [Symbiodinium natans]|uniref:RBCMT protein n=1 Tax=Symbiodinium natans TaxID=878477 RepID=A0A812J4Z5_9DINO|nr:RBCMT [Symbiodinium natans]
MSRPWRTCLAAEVALASSVISDRPHNIEEFPRVIWSFWHDEHSVPAPVQLAHASWKHFAPDYELRLLNGNNFKEYLAPGEPDVAPNSFHMMHLFADWLRVSLLAAFGGVWIDATFLLTAPLDLLVNHTARISGMHLEAALFENYFLAAKPKDEIIEKWRDEAVQTGRMTQDEYDVYLTKLKADGIEPLNGHMAECHWRSESPFHEIAHWILHRAVAVVNFFVGYTNFYLHPCGEHFWMQYYRACVAFNTVVRADGSDITKVCERLGIHAVDSIQTVNSVAVSKGWNTTRIATFLMTSESEFFDFLPVRGIKLRSKERQMLMEMTSCETGSIICRLQSLIGASPFRERAPASKVAGDTNTEL